MPREIFTDTDGVELPTHSANWVYNTGYLGASRAIINTNALCPGSVSIGSLTRYIGATFSADQQAEGVLTAVSTIAGLGPAVRVSDAGACSAYLMICYSNKSQTFKLVAGVATQLGSDTAGFAIGEKAIISIVGNVLTTKKDGVVLYTGTDSSLSSGSPGIYSEHSSTLTRLDDFDAIDLNQVRAWVICKDTAGTGGIGLQRLVYAVTFFGNFVPEEIARIKQIEVEVSVANEFTDVILRAALVAAVQAKALTFGLVINDADILEF